MKSSGWLLWALVALVLGACERQPAATKPSGQQTEGDHDSLARQPSSKLECPEGTKLLNSAASGDIVLGHSSTEYVCFDEQRRPVGRSIQVSDTGTVVLELFWDREHGLHGPMRRWRFDGSLERAGRYERGKKVGTWRTWGADGKTLRRVDRYVRGRRHGDTTYWREDGTLERREQYVEGEPVGVWTEWHPNGQKAAEIEYDDGHEVTLRRWDTEGRLIEP